ncbi:hypothetical protein NBRC13296_08130 [Paenibacillus chitinolyticus]|uniref:hypothetical protein n=1 Tax=Paenibacillus chitinolyticus TaxID=79263 RepID=UPI003556ECFD
MSHSLKLLSWNIEKFNADKMNDDFFIKYVARVIRLMEIDVAGIMEIVGWIGNEVCTAIVNELNQQEQQKATGVVWSGQASEMTPSAPNEQYVFVWKLGLFSSVEWKLWNVLGENAFDTFFATNNITDEDEKFQVTQSLAKNGWMNDSFMVPYSAYSKLVADPQNLDCTKKNPTLNLTAQQKLDLSAILTAYAPETFPYPRSRPPFILRVTTADTNTVITFVLFHAPGPSDSSPITASNQISLIDPVIQADVGVVMGDFNVTEAWAKRTWALQYYNWDLGRLRYVLNDSGQYIFAAPFQRLSGPDFASHSTTQPALTTVQNYSFRLQDNLTSMTSALVAPDAIADSTVMQSILSSPYDKFFVRSAQTDPSDPFVCNLVDLTTPKEIWTGTMDTDNNPVNETRSTTPSTYQRDLSSLTAAIYNNWYNRHAGKSTSLNLQQIPKLNVRPTSLREAQYAYYYAISDHMPICMELKYFADPNNDMAAEGVNFE